MEGEECVCVWGGGGGGGNCHHITTYTTHILSHKVLILIPVCCTHDVYIHHIHCTLVH